MLKADTCIVNVNASLGSLFFMFVHLINLRNVI